MGNTIFSAGAFVAVKIDDPGTHFGGKTVKGRVYLDVQKSSVTADSLNIRFYGQERSCVVYYVTVGHGKKRHRERRHAHATVKFFEVDYILHSYGGEVQQGRYEYPFEITLPVGIPGKLGGSSGDSHFLIDYHIEARLHRQGMLTWDVHNSVEILMLDPPYNRIPTPVFSTPSTVPVHSFCCIRSGTMTLAIKLDSNNVVGSEEFRAFYEISNQSTSRIKALEISVLQNLECRADGHVHQSSSTVFHKRIDASQLQNVAPMAKQDANLSSEQPEQGAIRALLDSLSRGQHFLNVTIPNTWAPTLLGALGAITYTLRVHIKTPFGVEDPLVDCALILHRTALSFEGVVPVVAQEYTLPPGWQPMNAIAPVQFSVPRVEIGRTVPDLIGSLQRSDHFSEVNILQEWMYRGDINQIFPQVMGDIFATIKSQNSDPIFAEIIGKAMNGMVPCAHIVSAAAALQPRDSSRITALLVAFSGHCGDKQSAATAFQELDLPAYALSSVLLYY